MAITFARAQLPASLRYGFKVVQGVLDEDGEETYVFDNYPGFSVLLIQLVVTAGVPTVSFEVATDDNVSFVPLVVWNVEVEAQSSIPMALAIDTLYTCNVTGGRYIRLTKAAGVGTACTFFGRFHKDGVAHTAITKQFA